MLTSSDPKYYQHYETFILEKMARNPTVSLLERRAMKSELSYRKKLKDEAELNAKYESRGWRRRRRNSL